MQIGFLLLNLFYFFRITIFDSAFDSKALSISTSIYAKISAFRNQESKGVNKGCCGVKQGAICLPCQFRFELVSRKYLYGTDDQNPTKRTVIGISSKPGNELIENYENGLIFDALLYTRHNIEIYSLEYPTSIQDTFEAIYSTLITKFLFQGTLSVNGFITIWAQIEIRKITGINNFFTAQFRLDSIYWINFRKTDSNCCSTKQTTECENECNYLFIWSIGGNLIENLYVNPLNNERQVNLSLTMTSKKLLLQDITLSYKVVILTQDTHRLIDTFDIPIINDIPYVEYKLLNARGIYGNVILNISWMHSCLMTQGINCANKCNADGVIIKCDPLNGKPFCLNGAIDVPICENIKADCFVNPCKNNGTCFVDSGKFYCSCPNGYYGKLCQDWQCDSGCNGNGICAGPNICNCIPPYIGKDCEGLPCLEEKDKKCGENGNCLIIAGEKTCKCTNLFFTGENCSEAICNPECTFGTCKFLKNMGKTRCVCNDLYEGPICDNPNISFQTNKSSGSYIGSLVVIVLILISLIVVLGLIITGKISCNQGAPKKVEGDKK